MKAPFIILLAICFNFPLVSALEKNIFEADHSELLLSVTYPGNVWHVLRDSSNPEYFTDIYRVIGDTLIGDTLWQIISYSKDSNASENGQWQTKFYLYENEKKLFCALPNDLSPKLYFDFDAEVDDQLELFVPYTQSFINVVVQDKQTILLGSMERKLVTILNNYAGETWIEGIGSLNGVFYGNIDPDLVGVQFNLRCFSQDYIVVYPVGFSENWLLSNESWPNEKSEWYYEVQPVVGCFPCIVKFQHIKVIGDTLIHDKACMIIEKSSPGIICDDMGKTKEYLYYEAQIVYWYNEHIDDFTVLYDFSAEKGSNWEIKVAECSFTVHVDSVSSISINGSIRKILHISDERNYFSGSIIEQIGHTTSMFPKDIYYECAGWACDSDFTNGLRCYFENGEVVFRKGTVDCDSTYQLDVQEYLPIIQDNAVWSVSRQKFTISGDTLINDTLYHKLYYHSYLPEFTPEELEYGGGMRECNEDKQVWFLPRGSSTEKLLYDFSLEAGDKTTIHAFFMGLNMNPDIFIKQEIEILAVDAVEIYGITRKRITLKPKFNVPSLEFWYEGIGSTSGLLHPAFSLPMWGVLDGGYPDLLCFTLNDEILYWHEYYDTCYHQASGVFVEDVTLPELDIKTILIDENRIEISCNVPFSEVGVIDITGKQVYRKTFSHPTEVHYLDIGHLRKGLYLIRLTSPNMTATEKIMR